MTRPPLFPGFPGFDGLLTLSRREGVDIRPTLLRVLTDLYVQTNTHSSDEARQFIELTSRLIDEVDDTTRGAVRARLSVYPGTPQEVLRKLGVRPIHGDQPAPPGEEIPYSPQATAPAALSGAQTLTASRLSMQPKDAAEICEMFFRATGPERVSILHSLADTPLNAASAVPDPLARRAIETLEMAAFAADTESFALEVGESLALPARLAAQIVDDPGGEPLGTAMRALAMPGPVFQRVLLFLKPEFGNSVQTVYRLSRLYDRLSERSALIMLAAWRSAMLATTRAKFRPTLYDDERQRARFAGTTARSAVQPGSSLPARTGTDDP
jgi:Uncharacterised protein conserved in bacteria (DUF2336)